MNDGDIVELGSIENAFTRGGNRLCFIDPRDKSRCIKIPRPDRTPEMRRQAKGFPKNLRSVASFDENREEFAVWQYIDEHIGEDAYGVIPRCYGFVETNMGSALVMDLVRDENGCISKTLKQVLWEGKNNDGVNIALNDFALEWGRLGIPSKKLLLHNMLIKNSDTAKPNIVVIDGLGWQSLIPFGKIHPWFARRQAAKKANQLKTTINELLEKKRSGKTFGYHGWLDDQQRAG